MDITPPQYLRTAPLSQLAGASARRLRRSERRAEARAAVEIGDTTEEAVNGNETTSESLEETSPAENAENTVKTVSEISISTLAVEKLTRLLI